MISFIDEPLTQQCVPLRCCLPRPLGTRPDAPTPNHPRVPARAGSHLAVAVRLGLRVYSESKKDLLVASSNHLHPAAHASPPQRTWRGAEQK